MIDYKKANSYFTKCLKYDDILMWRSKNGDLWVTDRYIAVHYPENQIRTFDPMQIKKQYGIEKLLQEVSGEKLFLTKKTKFLWLTEKKQYCVFDNKELLDKQFADILNADELFYDGKKIFIANDYDGNPVGIACSMKTINSIFDIFDTKDGDGE